MASSEEGAVKPGEWEHSDRHIDPQILRTIIERESEARGLNHGIVLDYPRLRVVVHVSKARPPFWIEMKNLRVTPYDTQLTKTEEQDFVDFGRDCQWGCLIDDIPITRAPESESYVDKDEVGQLTSPAREAWEEEHTGYEEGVARKRLAAANLTKNQIRRETPEELQQAAARRQALYETSKYVQDKEEWLNTLVSLGLYNRPGSEVAPRAGCEMAVAYLQQFKEEEANTWMNELADKLGKDNTGLDALEAIRETIRFNLNEHPLSRSEQDDLANQLLEVATHFAEARTKWRAGIKE